MVSHYECDRAPFCDQDREELRELRADNAELLAALKEIVNGDPAGATYSGSQCVEIARAAIAKAEGK